MPKIDRDELERMSKSKYGNYKIAEENKFLQLYYKLFLKNSTARVYLQGLITAAVITYGVMTKNYFPLYILFGYVVFVNITGIFYWQHEKKRLGREVQKTEQELQGIYKEIQERKSYFENLRDKLGNSKN